MNLHKQNFVCWPSVGPQDIQQTYIHTYIHTYLFVCDICAIAFTYKGGSFLYLTRCISKGIDSLCSVFLLCVCDNTPICSGGLAQKQYLMQCHVNNKAHVINCCACRDAEGFSYGCAHAQQPCGSYIPP